MHFFLPGCVCFAAAGSFSAPNFFFCVCVFVLSGFRRELTDVRPPLLLLAPRTGLQSGSGPRRRPGPPGPAGALAAAGMQRERLLKVLVIGDLGVGKTSVIRRYVHQVFSQHYRATIGVDFALKVLNWDHRTVVRLQLWDVAGQERYGNMTRVYYREAVGALVVFDMTRLSTFQAVLKWKGDLDSKVALNNGRSVPAVLLANKSDQRRLGLCPKLPKLENFSRDYGFVDWYETSAKDNTNIDAAITCLVRSIMSLEEESAPSDAATAAKAEAGGGVLVLPRLDNNTTEKKLAGCSGCPSLTSRGGGDD